MCGFSKLGEGEFRYLGGQRVAIYLKAKEQKRRVPNNSKKRGEIKGADGEGMSL